MFQRRRFVLTAAAAALAFGGGAAPAAGQSPPEKIAVATTVVHGACRDGGQLTVVVTAADGGYDIAATATGLRNGERWRGGFIEYNDEGQRDTTYLRTVADHGWSAERHLDGIDEPSFTAYASPKGDAPRQIRCLMFARPAQPLAGQSQCRGSAEVGLRAIRQPSGATLVRWGFSGARPHSDWEVEIAADSRGGDGVAVGIEIEASRRGTAHGHETFDLTDPRLRIKIRSDGGQRCSLTVARTLAE